VIFVCSHQPWEAGDELGSGGFGRVFAAVGDDGRSGVVKLVPKEPGAERELLFVDLGGARNVVPVVDTGETDDSWVLVMPRAEESLADHLDRLGALTVEHVLPVLVDIATALTDLNGRVVHRDLKPHNVLLLDGRWCLADFGISRYAEASTAPDTRKFAMSPPYAAPERWRAERATSATDVYAIGVIAHQLLTATLPFPGPTVEQFRDQHLHGEPPPVPGIPPRLASLISETLYKAPEARPTPADILTRLERAGTPPRLAGAARLGSVYQAEAARRAGQVQSESAAQSEEERRATLASSAQRSYQTLSAELAELINQEVAAAAITPTPDGSWSVELAGAGLSLSAPVRTGHGSWGGPPPAFDVTASASIGVRVPPNRFGYQGRSHSLYFCDARAEGVYGWYETAFMHSPFLGGISREAPFALDPGPSAAVALAPVMAEYQLAWPFTELMIGDADEFMDRWLSWFAAAAAGELQVPGTMPERDPYGSWRR